MKKIKLTKNKYALVDNSDFKWLSQWKWYASAKVDSHSFYVKRSDNIRMSRLLMNPPKGMLVDHINRNPLDNRKSNLRICTSSQNNMNRGSYLKNKTSKYKGIHFDEIRKGCILKNKWRATIQINKKVIGLGSLTYLQSAAIVCLLGFIKSSESFN